MRVGMLRQHVGAGNLASVVHAVQCRTRALGKSDAGEYAIDVCESSEGVHRERRKRVGPHNLRAVKVHVEGKSKICSGKIECCEYSITQRKPVGHTFAVDSVAHDQPEIAVEKSIYSFGKGGVVNCGEDSIDERESVGKLVSVQIRSDNLSQVIDARSSSSYSPWDIDSRKNPRAEQKTMSHARGVDIGTDHLSDVINRRWCCACGSREIDREKFLSGCGHNTQHNAGGDEQHDALAVFAGAGHYDLSLPRWSTSLLPLTKKLKREDQPRAAGEATRKLH